MAKNRSNKNRKNTGNTNNNSSGGCWNINLNSQMPLFAAAAHVVWAILCGLGTRIMNLVDFLFNDVLSPVIKSIVDGLLVNVMPDIYKGIIWLVRITVPAIIGIVILNNTSILAGVVIIIFSICSTMGNIIMGFGERFRYGSPNNNCTVAGPQQIAAPAKKKFTRGKTQISTTKP